ncbi:MAG TPA: AlkA N-terminal domain-containing protein [Frankiaceae bacterium]|jgi:AraC family transcriptional regulator of adaptative response / DNA-3-methyladenine glycosylase II|nr:AlkA N-terminal domain-containing protein [Frankiaceae bacterium]
MLDIVADPERCYRAVSSRDARFDGWFVTAVHSTKIYCRPSCPARLPRFEGVTFYANPAAAQNGGYRACKRCRPDASPGSPEWDIRADLAARAMRLIGDGVVDREGVSGLASRLGYTSRHLTRVLSEELGAGPLAVARAQRAQTARLLLETTDVSVTEVAYASGFASLRQFNDTIREIFATTPTALRQRRRTREIAEPGTVNLRLTYRQPCDLAATLNFLRLRAVPGVEAGDGDGFVRALDLPHGTGTVRLSEGPPGAGYARASLALSDLRDLTVAVARCRRLLDLDADPVAVDAVLGSGPLAGHVAARPGLRVPGTVDGAELAIRAVLGQQISVAGARTLAGRLSATYGRALPAPCGDVTHTFARTDELAKADPADLPMPASRARALIELCGALAVGDLVLDGSAERSDVEHRLLAMRGIGPWTAGYIRMRALRDPDVWLGTDLEIVKALARLSAAAAAAGPVDSAQWSPWRSYAVLQLWSGGPA